MSQMQSLAHKAEFHPLAITVPFTVLIDSREKAPFSFTGLHADVDKKRRPLFVPTQWACLPTGDYTIAGMEDRIAIERKSLADLYSTLGQHRERFEREHERMAEIASHPDRGFAAVVIEADWGTILTQPPKESKLFPKTIFRTSLAWSQRYGVHWVAAGSRRMAEIWTFRSLERFWKDHSGGDQQSLF